MSVLSPIRDYILNECNDLDEGKAKIIEVLDAAPIQDQQIKSMKVNVKYQIHNLTKLKFWVSNMILAKENLKVCK